MQTAIVATPKNFAILGSDGNLCFFIFKPPCLVAFSRSACYNGIMKKQSAPQEAITFKFRFPPIMYVLAYAVLLLCVAGVALSFIRIARNGIHGFNDVLKSPLLIAICIFCIAIVVAMLIRSRYIITEDALITQFGFIKSKFLIKSFTSITLNTDVQKLTVYMGEEYFALVISPEWNNDFVQAIRKINPDVEFNFTLSETKDTNEK